MRFALASLAALVAAALAQPHVREIPLFNPDPKTVANSQGWDNASPVAPATNAKRFAHNLPPLKPRAQRHAQRGAPHRLGTRVQAAPRAESSPLPPDLRTCNIVVGSADGTLGYVSPNFNSFGEYGQLVSTQDDALEISFSYSPDAPSQINFLSTNGPTATYPYMAAAVGFASTDNDLGPGSYNYAYIAGTKETPAGSTPVSESKGNSFSAATNIDVSYESAIWTYDPATQAITAQWINTDGSAPATSIVYANDANQAFAITGDVGAFQDAFGVPYPEVTFACAPVAAVSVPSRR